MVRLPSTGSSRATSPENRRKTPPRVPCSLNRTKRRINVWGFALRRKAAVCQNASGVHRVGSARALWLLVTQQIEAKTWSRRARRRA